MAKIGRPQGSKNKEDLNSLRKLLEIGFSNNRLAILDRINKLLSEASDLQDWKYLMTLKAQLEPKEVNANHTGLAPQQLSIVHNYDSNHGTRNGRIADTVQPEADTSMEHTS